MTETREVFEMVTKQTEPDLGSWKQQEDRQRTRAQRRKAGAFAVVAALVVAGGVAFALQDGDTTTGVTDQPTPSTTETVDTTPAFTSGFLGFIDLTTGETSMTDVIPNTSAIDVSPDGDRIVYIEQDGIVTIADLDGSNAQALTQTRSTGVGPTGPQWSPDGSSIVYQDGPEDPSMGNLFVVDVDSGQVRQITDTEAVTSENLTYMSPTFDPSGTTVMFTLPTDEGGEERYDLWSVPVTGGELTLVRQGATFGDYSPDGTQIAFIEDGGFGDLFVAPTAGGKAQKLATGEIVVPRWSPDGTRIAYTDGAGSVYVVDVETGEQTLVVQTEHLPAWVDDDTLSLTP